jgi:sporulation protein YlmC with PRC-barrel domain
MAQSAMADPAVRASTLIDYDVENSAGEGLGEIEDLMIGRNSGDVKYAVLGFGGFLDLGEKFFAIPLSAISLNPQDNNAIFDVPEETLENAPGIDTDNWPDTADPQWDMDTRNFWRDNVASPTGDIDAADRADQEITTDMGGDELVNEAGLRASELIGYNVFNNAGEELGEIDDLMVGFDSEQINYVILETGGFLDLGEQLFVIPVQAISVDPGQEQVLLDVNEEIFDNAPGFQAAEWPDFTQPDWDIDYWSYWNDSQLIPQDSMITPNQRESAIRASDLMGFNVVNAQDEDLGEIEDLVIGFDSHQIRYGVLSFGGFLGLGEEWVAVPLHMMTLTPAEEEVILDVTPETIEAAPRFTDDEWPDLNTPDWDLDYQQYWGPEVVR